MSRKTASLALLLLFVLSAQACGSAGDSSLVRSKSPGQSTAQQAESAGQVPLAAALSLPSPAELAGHLGDGTRVASFEQEDLLRQAEEFNAALPFNRVSADGDSTVFSPNWFDGDPASGLAYAMYSFQLPEYDGGSTLRYSWKQAPTNPERVYVAFANWGHNRWKLFNGNAEGHIELGDIDPFLIAGGNLLLCFLMMGESQGDLDSLRIGSLPPQVTVSADRPADLAPCEFTLTAAASDPDGTIAEYRWDPEGDGSFDVSTGSDPQFVFSTDTVGRLSPAVRAIDNNGIFAEATADIAVYGQGALNFGFDSTHDSGKDLLVGSDGRLLIIGSVGQQLMFSGLDPAGELLFSKVSTLENDLLPSSCTLGSDSFVYIAAFNLLGPVMQKWSQDGANIWSKRWPNPNNGFDLVDETCALPDGNVVFAGSREVPVGNRVGVLLCLNPDGDVVWKREINSAANDARLNDVECFVRESGVEIRVCGTFVSDSPDDFYAAFDSAGTLLDSQIWDTDSFDERCTSIVSLPTGEIYIAGFMPVFGVDMVVVNKVGGSETLLIKDPDDLDLRLTDLFPIDAGRLQFILRRELSESIVGYLDAALSVQSAELFTSSDDYLLYKTSSLGLNGQLLIGESKGSLPTPVVYTPEHDASDLAVWVDFAADFSAGPLALEDTEVSVTDVTAEIVIGDDANTNHALVIRTAPAP